MINHFFTHPPKRKYSYKRVDPQRGEVYRMERDILGSSIDAFTPLDKLQGIADHACRKNSCPKVRVNSYAKAEKVFGYCNEEGIYLNKNYHGHNLPVLLHELAHWICFKKYPEATDHGPTFCDIYRHLLDSYKVLPAACFNVLARKYNVIVGEYNESF